MSSVREALTAADIDPAKANIAVNGKPADLDAPVKDGDSVTLTEKVAGS